MMDWGPRRPFGTVILSFLSRISHLSVGTEGQEICRKIKSSCFAKRASAACKELHEGLPGIAVQ